MQERLNLQRILVVDEDLSARSLVGRGLSFARYAVELAPDGESALAMASTHPTDLVVMDVVLPGVDGIEVCRRLRMGVPDLPILVLTGKAQVNDRVAGLEAGADDYMAKPFVFDELLARIRALLRRASPARKEVLRFSDLVANVVTREVERGGRRIDLTTKEYELLEFFLRHPRHVLARDLIFERVWGLDFLGESNVIEVHVMRLRSKLESAGEKRLIHTIRGAGYSLRES